jgi:predicted nucleic acid-binding Zn ribbon protein
MRIVIGDKYVCSYCGNEYTVVVHYPVIQGEGDDTKLLCPECCITVVTEMLGAGL